MVTMEVYTSVKSIMIGDQKTQFVWVRECTAFIPVPNVTLKVVFIPVGLQDV